MKNVCLVVLMAIAAATLAGCEDYDEEPLHFLNSSSYTVTITSLSLEWSGFALAPGTKHKLSGIRDVDYTFEPKEKVQEGSASTERSIIFVITEPAEPVAAPPTVREDLSLRFVNRSSYTVYVTSLSTEWTGFSLAPGQSWKKSRVHDVDYTYEPKDKVQEGFASTARSIVFVNAGEK